MTERNFNNFLVIFGMFTACSYAILWGLPPKSSVEKFRPGELVQHKLDASATGVVLNVQGDGTLDIRWQTRGGGIGAIGNGYSPAEFTHQ